MQTQVKIKPTWSENGDVIVAKVDAEGKTHAIRTFFFLLRQVMNKSNTQKDAKTVKFMRNISNSCKTKFSFATESEYVVDVGIGGSSPTSAKCKQSRDSYVSWRNWRYKVRCSWMRLSYKSVLSIAWWAKARYLFSPRRHVWKITLSLILLVCGRGSQDVPSHWSKGIISFSLSGIGIPDKVLSSCTVSCFDLSSQTAGPIRLKFGSNIPLLTGNGDCIAHSGHVIFSGSKWPTE